jgi:hypothetical protein
MLNNLYYGIASLVLLGAYSVASSATTLLIKSTTPGYSSLETAIYNSCSLDDAGLLILKAQLNGLTATQPIAHQFSLITIKKAITEAARGKVIKPKIMIADAPSNNYYAYYKKPDGKMAKVLLIEDNGQPALSIRNESSAALTLRNFMDAICRR